MARKERKGKESRADEEGIEMFTCLPSNLKARVTVN